MARPLGNEEKNKQLWNACLKGNLEKARQYLAEGADMNWKGEGNKSSLDIAAYMNRKEIVDLLVNEGVNVNAADETNRTPLHSAAMFGNLSSMKALVDAGADVNSETQNGVTPLLVSANIGDLDSIQYLVSRGADWTIATKKEKVNPYSIAKKENHSNVVDYLDELEISEKILKKALSEGHVSIELTRLSIHGPPGSGKSCLERLLLNQDPPEERISTNVATAAVRAATTYTCRASQSEETISKVSESDFLAIIARGIKDKQDDYLHEAGWLERWSAQFKAYMFRSPAHEDPLVSTAQEMLSLFPTERPSSMLFDARWIFSIDSGGQAAFQDIAPAFLRCNSLNIITLRLTDKLDDLPSLDYVINGQCFKSQKQNLSNLDIIVSFARSLSALEPKRCNPYKIAKPRLLVVGTFSDRADECREESLEEKNRRLCEALGAYMDLCILSKDSMIIHPVNTLVSKEEGRESIAAEWCNIIKLSRGISEKVDLPIRWFVFELEVSKEAERTKCHVMSKEKCVTIGARLGMDRKAVENAIEYLNALGLFMYFKSILSEVVFVHPNSLLTTVSELVSLAFIDTSALLHNNAKLRLNLAPTDLEKLRNGYLCPNVIEALWELQECTDASVLSHDSFTILLEHLCIISKIELPNTQDVVYFMPCILPWLPVTPDEERHYVTNSVEPVVLTWWNEKPFFYGVFPALVNDLLAHGFKLHQANIFKQRRNAISFSSQKHDGWILLVEDTCQLRIYYTGPSSDCADVLKMVEQGIENVMLRLNYSENVCSELYKAFLCPYQTSTTCAHLARVSYTKSQARFTLKCDLCVQQSSSLDPHRQLPWFTKGQGTGEGEVQYCSVASPECDIINLSNIPCAHEDFATEDVIVRADIMTDILTALFRLHNWKQLGKELGFTDVHLAVIEKEYGAHNYSACKKSMIWKWLTECENCTKQSLECALNRIGAKCLSEYTHPEVLVVPTML